MVTRFHVHHPRNLQGIVCLFYVQYVWSLPALWALIVCYSPSTLLGFRSVCLRQLFRFIECHQPANLHPPFPKTTFMFNDLGMAYFSFYPLFSFLSELIYEQSFCKSSAWFLLWKTAALCDLCSVFPQCSRLLFLYLAFLFIQKLSSRSLTNCAVLSINKLDENSIFGPFYSSGQSLYVG